MGKRAKSNCILILTAMIWGFAFVAQKEASGHIGPFTFNGIRFMIGSFTLVPVILLLERRNLADRARLRHTLLFGAITGTVLFAASALQQMGVSMIAQAGKAGFITGLYTVLVPVFGIFLGKKTGWNVWLGAVLAVAGLYLVSVAGTPTPERGDLLLLAGAVFWAIHILVIDRFVSRVSPIAFSSAQFFTCGVINLLCLAIFERSTFSAASLIAAGASILYAGFLSSGVAYTLQVVGQKNARPAEASILLSLESVFGCVGCMLILGDRMSLPAICGCGLILAGIVLSQIVVGKANPQ